MLKKAPFACGNSLSEAVQECLPMLEALALKVEIYGDEADGAKLRTVIGRLQSASPIEKPNRIAPTDFVVNGTFKVSRQQVANTLWHAFTGEIGWFRITETVPPRNLSFRSIDQTTPGIVDYPLNEGGIVRMVSTGPNAETFELRFDNVAPGLEVLAIYYPRHFADLVNENADSVTGDALLQCCIFGELVYG